MGNYNTQDTYYPAGFGQGIIAVGATNRNDTRWDQGGSDGSNYGNHIDVVAPGRDILSSVAYYRSTYSGYYDMFTGTSMATPLVSGIAGLLLAENPALYNDDIEQIIRISAEDVNSSTYPGWDQYLGTGRVNAKKALDLIRSPNEVKQWTANGGSSVGNTEPYFMNFYSTPGLAWGIYLVIRYDVQETVSFPETFGSTPDVWGRGVASIGYSEDNPNYDMGWCNVVPGSVTTSGATLRTYVYQVWTIYGSYRGWYPTDPSGVTFAYTALGDLPPAAPQNLTATKVWSTPLSAYYPRLSWTGVSDPDLRRYRIDRSDPYKPGPLYTTATSYDDEVMHWDDSNPDQVCYTVRAEDWSGLLSGPSNQVCVHGELNKGIGEMADVPILPGSYELHPAHPNPFNPSTTIRYGLPQDSRVQLTIYDIMGREVYTHAAVEEAGYQSVTWRGKDISGKAVPSGIYIYRLRAIPAESGEPYIATRKMLLLK